MAADVTNAAAVNIRFLDRSVAMDIYNLLKLFDFFVVGRGDEEKGGSGVSEGDTFLENCVCENSVQRLKIKWKCQQQQQQIHLPSLCNG